MLSRLLCRLKAISSQSFGPFSLLSFVILSHGCSESSGDVTGEAAAFSARDSAGVMILENRVSDSGSVPEWSIGSSPALRIGVLEGDDPYVLFQVRDARRLPDGRILIANGGTEELRLFDAQGGHVRTFAGEGEGPGEFQLLDWFQLTEDSVVAAYDARLRRLTWFELDGRVLSSASAVVPDEPIGVEARALFSDGSFLGTYGVLVATSGDSTRVERDVLTLGRFERTGGRRMILGEFPEAEYFIRSTGSGVSNSNLPFGRNTAFLVYEGEIYIADSDRFQIDVYGEDGGLRRRIRAQIGREVLTEEVAEQDRQRRLDAFDDPTIRRLFGPSIEATPYPEFFPAFEQVVIDSDGFLWVQRYPIPGVEEAGWIVFDREGRIVTEIELPVDLTVTEIGRDYLLGVTRDELDVESVQLFELIRGS